MFLFPDARESRISTDIEDMRVGDLDGDGDPDIVVAVAADLDGDGRTDVATTEYDRGRVATLLNRATGPVAEASRRSDLDASGLIQIGANVSDAGDVASLLRYLFSGAPPLACMKAADVDDGGRIRIKDAVYLLRYFFLGGDPPPEPFHSSGLDPTPDGLDECLSPNSSCR